jgi:hypothetical protein
MTPRQYAYRNKYLKSEHWQNLRLKALVKAKGSCFICSHQSPNNDVHHIYYPKRLNRTALRSLVVLCRDCHDKVHTIIDPDKLRSPRYRKIQFRLAVKRIQKQFGIERKRKQKLRHPENLCMVCAWTGTDVKEVNHFRVCSVCCIRVAVEMRVASLVLENVRGAMRPFCAAIDSVKSRMLVDRTQVVDIASRQLEAPAKIA